MKQKIILEISHWDIKDKVNNDENTKVFYS